MTFRRFPRPLRSGLTRRIPADRHGEIMPATEFNVGFAFDKGPRGNKDDVSTRRTLTPVEFHWERV